MSETLTRAELRHHHARRLYDALRARETVAPLIVDDPSLTIDDAYAISLATRSLREADGELVIGKKIGVTSKAVQDMLGVHQPDFGFLTDRMWVKGDIDVAREGLIQPRAEAEIAFILGEGLRGPGVTAEQVIAATEAIAPCFEIVDSRIRDWRIGIVDTVADNASSGLFVLGGPVRRLDGLDLRALHIQMTRQGEVVSKGSGAACLGNPLNAMAWLAGELARRKTPLRAGDIVLSGSLGPMVAVKPGDAFEATITGLGTVSARFAAT